MAQRVLFRCETLGVRRMAVPRRDSSRKNGLAAARRMAQNLRLVPEFFRLHQE
jgi:hypothetical protein